jgi:hypothetical protein
MENKFKQRLFDIIGLELYKTRINSDELSKHYKRGQYRLIWYRGLTIHIEVQRTKCDDILYWEEIDVITLPSIPNETDVLEEMDLIMFNHLYEEKEEWLKQELVSPYQDW